MKASPKKLKTMESDTPTDRVRRVSIVNMSRMENRLSTIQTRISDAEELNVTTTLVTDTQQTEETAEEMKTEEDVCKIEISDYVKTKEADVPPPPYMPELLDRE